MKLSQATQAVQCVGAGLMSHLKKISQVTTSTVKQYQVHISNGLKGHLIADFTQSDSIYWSSSSQLTVKSGQATKVELKSASSSIIKFCLRLT